jgi:hypothetical protein
VAWAQALNSPRGNSRLKYTDASSAAILFAQIIEGFKLRYYAQAMPKHKQTRYRSTSNSAKMPR